MRHNSPSLDTPTAKTPAEILAQTAKDMASISYRLIAVFVDPKENDVIAHQEGIPIFRPDNQRRDLFGALRFLCRGKPGMILEEVLVYDANAQRSKQTEAYLRKKTRGKTTEEITLL